MHRLQSVVRHLAAVPQPLRVASVRCLATAAATSATAAAAAPESAPVRAVAHPNGCLTLSLHRPKALNALNLQMVHLLKSGLATPPLPGTRRKCVLLYGEGERALCAGGDIRALAFPSHPTGPVQFFRHEYTLNHAIASVPQPYVSVLRGITMGGGVGISVHGKVRVVTDNTLFAMPETGIGLFPDVGGTWFLPRLPGSLGMYLALTGAQLGAADCMYAGIGTHFVPLKRIAEFISAVESSAEPVADTLSRFSSEQQQPAADSAATTKPHLRPHLQLRRALIDRTFSAATYEGVVAALTAAARSSSEASERQWLESVLQSLSTKSPTSLLITFHAMQLGAQATSLADCLATELRLGARITAEGQTGDFAEGVKAVVIDKNHKPKWKPMPTMQHVIDTYFQPFTKEEGIEELKL